MPVYGSDSPYETPPTLNAGRPVAVWDDEGVETSPPETASSQSVGLHRYPNLPTVLSVEVRFAEDPGVFALDLQIADTDEDEFYVTKATLDGGLNDAFVGRIEAINVVGKFARLRMSTLTNAVNVTAKFF